MGRLKKEVAPPPEGSALALALHAVKSQFGTGVAFCPGEQAIPGIDWISSGSLGLDMALGGGYPRGRMVEIFGAEMGGKTTGALHAIANAQKAGATCAFIDAEHALDINYAEALQVQIDKLILSQPDSAEQALEVFHIFAKSGAFAVIVLDSVAALVPRAELEGEIGDSFMGLQARLMGQAMRKLTSALHASNTLGIFLNQTRQKIGIVYGSPEVTSGGLALKFFASQRIRLSKKEQINEGTKEDKKVTAIVVKAQVTKNKVAPPFMEAEFRIKFGVGIDTLHDLVQVGISEGILEKAGAWIKYEGSPVGQGVDDTIGYLGEHPELCEIIRKAALGGKE